MMTMTKRRMLNADVGGIGALSWELMLSLCTGNKQKNNAHDDNASFHPPQCYFILPPRCKPSQMEVAPQRTQRGQVDDGIGWTGSCLGRASPPRAKYSCKVRKVKTSFLHFSR